jgi:hypothetical protein
VEFWLLLGSWLSYLDRLLWACSVCSTSITLLEVWGLNVAILVYLLEHGLIELFLTWSLKSLSWVLNYQLWSVLLLANRCSIWLQLLTWVEIIWLSWCLNCLSYFLYYLVHLWLLLLHCLYFRSLDFLSSCLQIRSFLQLLNWWALSQ